MSATRGETVLAVESLTKVHTDVHEVRYTPTMSIFWRLRDRRAGYSIPASDAGGVDIDADDDADDDDDQQDEDFPVETPSGATLSDVSFDVARGEAVALVGRDQTPIELAKILSGVTNPSSGRVVAEGRISPGAVLFVNLMKREPHPRRAARALAALAGIPRRARRRYARELLARVIDEESANASSRSKVNPLVRRVALAAQFDTSADVLVVDTWPAPRTFGDQFVDVVREALSGGSAVLLVNPPPWVEPLCARAIWLENAEIVRDGPATQVLPELKHAIDEDRRREAHVVLGFDQYLAIQGVEVRHAGRRVHAVEPDDDMDVVVHFEASVPLESAACTVSFRGARGTIDLRQDPALAFVPAGRHAVAVSLAAGALPDGDYAIDAAFVADHAHGASRLAWPQAGRVRVSGASPDDEELAVEAGQMPPLVDLEEAASWQYLEAVEA